MTARALLLTVMALGWWRVPAALGSSVDSAEAHRRHRSLAVGCAAVVGGAMTLLAWMSGPILDWLEVDTETFRIATGLVVAAVGLARTLGWGSRPEQVDTSDGRAGLAHNLWPVAYPVLSGPVTVAASISVGSDHGVALVVAGAVVGVGLTWFAGGLRGGGWAGHVVRFAGVVLMVLATALIFDGLRDV